MTPEQQAAYIISQSVCAFLDAQGMIAENKRRADNGLSLAYGEGDFYSIPARYGIDSNSVMLSFQR